MSRRSQAVVNTPPDNTDPASVDNSRASQSRLSVTSDQSDQESVLEAVTSTRDTSRLRKRKRTTRLSSAATDDVSSLASLSADQSEQIVSSDSESSADLHVPESHDLPSARSDVGVRGKRGRGRPRARGRARGAGRVASRRQPVSSPESSLDEAATRPLKRKRTIEDDEDKQSRSPSVEPPGAQTSVSSRLMGFSGADDELNHDGMQAADIAASASPEPSETALNGRTQAKTDTYSKPNERAVKLSRTYSTGSRGRARGRAASPRIFASTTTADISAEASREASVGATARKRDREGNRIAKDVVRQRGLATLQRERELIEAAEHPLLLWMCEHFEREWADRESGMPKAHTTELESVQDAQDSLEMLIWTAYQEDRSHLRTKMLRQIEIDKRQAFLQHWRSDAHGGSFLNVDAAPEPKIFDPVPHDDLFGQQLSADTEISPLRVSYVQQRSPSIRRAEVWKMTKDAISLDLESMGLRKPSVATQRMSMPAKHASTAHHLPGQSALATSSGTSGGRDHASYPFPAYMAPYGYFQQDPRAPYAYAYPVAPFAPAAAQQAAFMPSTAWSPMTIGSHEVITSRESDEINHHKDAPASSAPSREDGTRSRVPKAADAVPHRSATSVASKDSSNSLRVAGDRPLTTTFNGPSRISSELAKEPLYRPSALVPTKEGAAEYGYSGWR